MAASNILLYKFVLCTDLSSAQIIDRLEQQILDETRFVIDEYSDSEISGTYVYSFLYKSVEYDFDTNSFQNVTNKKYVTAEFHVNLEKNYMDIWGSSQNASKIITAISIAIDNKVVIEPLDLEFSKIIEYLKETDGVMIGKITATQVAFSDGIIADCTIDLSDYNKPFNVIEKYKKNIDKISIKWVCEDVNIGMLIYTSGSIRIYRLRRSINIKQLHMIYQMLECSGRR